MKLDGMVIKKRIADLEAAVAATTVGQYGYTELADDTTALALAANISVRLTVTGDKTLTSTIPAAGIRCAVIILTSGTSTHTITFGTGFKSSGTLATGGADAKFFVINFISNGTSLQETGRTAAITA